MKFYPVFLPLRIRKKALEKREETIIVDRACRQETLAYEMVSSLSSCRISRQFSTAKIQLLVVCLVFFHHCGSLYTVSICRYEFAGND